MASADTGAPAPRYPRSDAPPSRSDRGYPPRDARERDYSSREYPRDAPRDAPRDVPLAHDPAPRRDPAGEREYASSRAGQQRDLAPLRDYPPTRDTRDQHPRGNGHNAPDPPVAPSLMSRMNEVDTRSARRSPPEDRSTPNERRGPDSPAFDDRDGGRKRGIDGEGAI
jgi:hypothetical protein